MLAPTHPALATAARLIPIRWRQISWAARITNLTRLGRHARRHWLFSAVPLTRVGHPEPRRSAVRRRSATRLHFRPLTVFTSTTLRRSFLSPLNQHPGL